MHIVMGLDVGTQTIGVAVSDGLGMMAHPVTTVSRRGVRQDSAEIAALAVQHRVAAFVVGLPLELDGREERSARLARQVGEALKASTGLPVHYADERFSSVDAERRLIAAGASRARRKAVIDQAAAALILQMWMDEGGLRRLDAPRSTPRPPDEQESP